LEKQQHTTNQNGAPPAGKRRVVATAETPRERYLKWRRRTATVMVGMLALVMGYGVVFGHDGLTAFEHKRQQEHVLQQQMQELQKENDQLSGRVERLQQGDPDAVEHEAREELHYTRAGEVIITLPPKSVATDAPQSASHP
jgi:cell division protein FtsB